MKAPTSPENECAKWRSYPLDPGMYVVWERGQKLDIFYWPGEDHPVFELPTSDSAKYFGPFLLPLSV